MPDIWYKRQPAKFLNGVADMTPEQRGIYGTLIDIIYDKGGIIAHNPKSLAMRCGATTRQFNRVFKYLLEHEKFDVHDGYIMSSSIFRKINKDFMTKLSQKYCVLNYPELAKNKGLDPARSKEAENDRSKESTTTLGAGENLPEKINVKQLQKRLADAGGDMLNWQNQGIGVLKVPISWITGQNAASIDDLESTVKALCDRRRANGQTPVSSWNYFRNALFEIRDQRLAGNPKPNLSNQGRRHDKSGTNKFAKSESLDRAVFAAAADMGYGPIGEPYQGEQGSADGRIDRIEDG